MPSAKHRRSGSGGRWKGWNREGESGAVKVSGGPIEKERMEARYKGQCCNCRREVAKGERIVYFPGRKVGRGKPPKPARIMCDGCASLPAAERAERREAAG